MTWIKKTRQWIEPKAAARAAAPPPEPDLLDGLVPEDIKDKANYNPWDVARICSCTKRTIMNWIADGLLDVVRLPGGNLRISKPALRHFLAKYNTPAAPGTKKSGKPMKTDEN
ncbi:MAG: helix-turn-helix domain-containing protein [Nitrospirales bacterium]